MKKSLIPILSLAFIISLDSCKKDSDNQPAEEATRVVKTHYNYSTDPTTETTYYEYDNSGRIISLKDSVNSDSYVTISYVGDEAIFQKPLGGPGNNNYSARYKLNSNHLPIQRIITETMDNMTATQPGFQIQVDTCKFEYDAAGLLVKATGSHYDSLWSKYNTSISFNSTRKAYTIDYTNKDGKLMSFKVYDAAVSSYTNGGSSFETIINTEDNYSFEYTKNYANKIDSINAWLFFELGALYGEEYPIIKYANLPDVKHQTTKRTNVTTGDVYNYSGNPITMELEYLPSGYVSSIRYIYNSNWDKTSFIYNK